MIDIIREAPAWVLDHPWWSALAVVSAMVILALPILVNPKGRQVRDLWRNR